jgi:hypothetical protein
MSPSDYKRLTSGDEEPININLTKMMKSTVEIRHLSYLAGGIILASVAYGMCLRQLCISELPNA